MHPFHMLGVAGVFGGSLFSAMHELLLLIDCALVPKGANENWVKYWNTFTSIFPFYP